MQKILTAVCVILLINSIILFWRAGVGNTLLLNLGLAFGTGIYAAFYDRLRRSKWLNRFIIILLGLYVGLGLSTFIYGSIDTVTFEEDVAIVLGAGVRGEDVSRTLQSRLDMAVYYHFRNPDAIIIVSGGLGSQAVISEAEAMARYLIENGVPPDVIVREDRSHSTYQNMQRSMELIEEMFTYVPQVVVITNEFHIYRGVNFARIAGMGEANSFHGNTPLLNLPAALVREVPAIIKMWVIGT